MTSVSYASGSGFTNAQFRSGDFRIGIGYTIGFDLLLFGSIRDEEDKLAGKTYDPVYNKQDLYIETGFVVLNNMEINTGYKFFWISKSAKTDDYKARYEYDEEDGLSGDIDRLINEQLLLRYNCVYTGMTYYNDLGSFNLPVFFNIGYNHFGKVHKAPHLNKKTVKIEIDNRKPNLYIEPGIGYATKSNILFVGLYASYDYSLLHFNTAPYGNTKKDYDLHAIKFKLHIGTVF